MSLDLKSLTVVRRAAAETTENKAISAGKNASAVNVPIFERVGVPRDVSTDKVKHNCYVSAGWAYIGSLKSAVEACGRLADVEVRVTLNTELFGRTAIISAEGASANIERFKRAIRSLG